MLAPDLRRLYSECFAAPPGHALDCALGTTYSLDLDSLLFALFCLATSGVEDPDEALGNPVALLEAIHRVGDHVTLFAHAGETHAPDRPRALYALLERCLVPAQGRGGAIFHPKVWVLRHRSRATGAPLLRVVVLSRNLTNSRAWDTFVCLEGSPGPATCDESRELAELVRALPSFALPGHPPSEGRLDRIASLATDIERTRFEAPSPFDGLATFMALGLRQRRWELPRADRLLALSPFVSSETLIELRSLAPRAQLIGRAEEMTKCASESLSNWNAFVLHDGASSDAELADDSACDDPLEAAPQGLHAKILVLESNQRATWWLGSANLTDPARSGVSVELMVQLSGKLTKVGIDAFWDAGFGALLVPYQHQASAADPADGSRSLVERAKRRMCEAKLELLCEREGDNRWLLRVEGEVPDLEGVEATCRPVSLAPHRELSLCGGAGGCRFSGLSTEALTAFVAVHLVAGRGDARFELAFTVKLPITGLPEERDARVAGAIIKDRAAFMSYLRCLLTDLGASLGDVAADRGTKEGGSEAPAAAFAAGLLESMLQTLHRDPHRLRGLGALLSRCESSPSDSAIIPDEVRRVWAAVEPHLLAAGQVAS